MLLPLFAKLAAGGLGAYDDFQTLTGAEKLSSPFQNSLWGCAGLSFWP
jgi:hypothetical protein